MFRGFKPGVLFARPAAACALAEMPGSGSAASEPADVSTAQTNFTARGAPSTELIAVLQSGHVITLNPELVDVVRNKKRHLVSVAPVSFTAENQRLKVSALTCGFNAADNFVHNWLHSRP